jgi:hypothetical protein
MPDMTVVWKDAVPFDTVYNQSANRSSGKARAVLFDARAQASGMQIRPLLDETVESVYAGAIPYDMAGEDFDWAADFQAATEKPKQAGRPRKKV